MMTAPVAPALGRLAAPARGRASDDIRLALVDRIVAAHAAGTLTGSEWLAAWQQAAGALADRVLEGANGQLDRAAHHVKYPAARLAAMRPDPDAVTAMLNRFLAEGVDLERLEAAGDDPAVTRARGVALEAAWGAAVRLADVESSHWQGVAASISGWRRPWRPLVITATILWLFGAVFGAMLGGLIRAPQWFAPISDWFWGLPWP